MSKDVLDKLVVIEDFYRHGMWFLDLGEGIRLYGASIKVEASGYLMILRGRSAEGPQVAFVGSQTLTGVRSKLMGYQSNGGLKWRADKFALDGLGETG